MKITTTLTPRNAPDGTVGSVLQLVTLLSRPGAPGTEGPQGATGPAGADSVVPGPTGPAGADAVLPEALTRITSTPGNPPLWDAAPWPGSGLTLVASSEAAVATGPGVYGIPALPAGITTALSITVAANTAVVAQPVTVTPVDTSGVTLSAPHNPLGLGISFDQTNFTYSVAATPAKTGGYSIRATTGLGAASDVTVAYVSGITIPIPQNVIAGGLHGAVVVAWSVDAGFASHNIYWTKNGDVPSKTQAVDANHGVITGAANPYTHSGLPLSTLYKYAVTGMVGATESDISTVVQAYSSHPNLQISLPLISDAVDVSGNSRNGTLVGAPSFIASSVGDPMYPANVLRLAGSGTPQYISLDAHLVYLRTLGATSYTVFAKVRPRTEQNNAVVLGWFTSNAVRGYERYFNLAADNRYFTTYKTLPANELVSIPKTVAPSVFHDLAVVYTATSTKVYVDDALLGTIAADVRFDTAMIHALIGMTWYDNAIEVSTWANCDLSDFRIYNIECNATDVIRLGDGLPPLTGA
jgi:hypothetical protein